MRIRYHKDILIAGCYTLLTILLTYPVAFRLTSHLAGFPGEDNLQWRWFLWWFKHSILTLHTSVTNLTLLYAPLGGEQPLYAISSFVPALALPVTLLAGPTVSFNLSFLLSFVLSGYTAYLLAYYLTRHRQAAFVSGLIFAFYPARFGYATGTFLGQLTVYLLPLYVLALFLLARRPNRRRAVWAAILLACLCLTWPLHVAYGVAVFTAALLLRQGFVWLRRPGSRNSIKYFALSFGLALLLVIGPYLPLLISILQKESGHLGNSNTVNFSVDLLAFVVPSNHHPILQPLDLLPDYATHVLADRDDIQERLAYVGLVPFLLVLLGLARYRRKLLFWLLVALTTMILSLGPLLKIRGKLLQVNIEGYVGYVLLPYTLLRSIPILDWSGTLGRLNVPAMLCIAVMAAYGSLFLLSLLKSRWHFGIVGLLSTLVLLEYLTIFPFSTTQAAIPEFYYQLRQEGQSHPQQIIDLPLRKDPRHNNYSMHYQTVHQQPIAGGHFIRKPAGVSTMTSFLDQLLLPPLEQTAFRFPPPQDRLALLNRFGFTKVIARPWLMIDPASTAQLNYLATWLGKPHLKGTVSVFEVPRSQAPTSQLTGLLDGDGWQVVEERLRLQSPAELLVFQHQPQPQPVWLQLSLSAPNPDRYLTIDLDDQPAIRLYLYQEQLDYRLPLTFSPGPHRFTFYPEEACRQNCEAVTFGHIEVNPAAVEDLNSISFGNKLALIKKELSATSVVPAQPILTYFYWQGQAPLSEDYSAFVHLVAPSGRLISQADYLLGGWLYPTSAWPTGHITAAPTLLFVPPDTPPGEYQLRVGLYNAETGERVLVGSDLSSKDYFLVSKIIVSP